jgi:ribosome-associated heat shock protein Hsp15
MQTPESVRIDKFLWAIRLYKTRTAAAAACTGGKVRINDLTVKASRNVRAGETIIAEAGGITRTVKILKPLEKRVGAKGVPEYIEDLTPESEFEKAREPNLMPFVFRPKGSGRPTKKQRREIEGLEF